MLLQREALARELMIIRERVVTLRLLAFYRGVAA
jgi:hypothetical protein